MDRFSPANLLNPDPALYWTCDDNNLTPEVVMTFANPERFNVVSLREYLPLGQRVAAFALDTWQAGGWQPLASATSIGSRRLLRTPLTTTSALRLRITQSATCPALSELSLWLDPQA
jgi:alpha-L-fucosidase